MFDYTPPKSILFLFVTLNSNFIDSADKHPLLSRNPNECRVIIQTPTDTTLFSNQDQKQIDALINDLYNQKNDTLVYTLLAIDFLFSIRRKDCGDRCIVNMSTQATTTDYVKKRGRGPYTYYHPRYFPPVQLSCPANIKICSKNQQATDFILKTIDKIGLKRIRILSTKI